MANGPPMLGANYAQAALRQMQSQAQKAAQKKKEEFERMQAMGQQAHRYQALKLQEMNVNINKKRYEADVERVRKLNLKTTHAGHFKQTALKAVYGQTLTQAHNNLGEWKVNLNTGQTVKRGTPGYDSASPIPHKYRFEAVNTRMDSVNKMLSTISTAVEVNKGNGKMEVIKTYETNFNNIFIPYLFNSWR